MRTEQKRRKYSSHLQERFWQTYCGSGVEEIWNYVIIMCDLMKETAQAVGDKILYLRKTKQGAAWFLKHVRPFPKEAENIYEQKVFYN